MKIALLAPAFIIDKRISRYLKWVLMSFRWDYVNFCRSFSSSMYWILTCCPLSRSSAKYLKKKHARRLDEIWARYIHKYVTVSKANKIISNIDMVHNYQVNTMTMNVISNHLALHVNVMAPMVCIPCRTSKFKTKQFHFDDAALE
jgi:hypothetical protein